MRIVARPQLDRTEAASIRDLAQAVEAEDGAPPLSDQALAQLNSPSVDHVVVGDNDTVLGYAQRNGATVEIVGRHQALSDLVEAAVRPGARVWSHGRRSRLVPILSRRGLDRIRELHQLRRELSDLPPVPPLPDHIRVRTFVPGADDEAWLELNHAAFATHPEQGSWTAADLAARMSEQWFDPSGFLLAEDDGQLLGFHWTKVHPDGLGEVYVLGVSPAAQGLGLGNALLVRGLHHLADRGCPAVLLYVDGDNEAALRLYERAGFTRFDLDVQWQLAVD